METHTFGNEKYTHNHLLYMNSQALNAECGCSSVHSNPQVLLCINISCLLTKSTGIRVFFTYYQLFKITVNHFIFSQAIINKSIILFSYKRNILFFDHNTEEKPWGGPLSLLASAEHGWFLQTQMRLGCQVWWFFIEVQWTFLDLFSLTLTSTLKWTKLHHFSRKNLMWTT
jgi:hypothetical protein